MKAPLEDAMNHKPNLESLDLDLLAAFQRERQTEMRRDAHNAYLLGAHASSRKGGRAALKRRLELLVVATAALIALWLVILAAFSGV
jgi:hypothetical protein